MAGGWSRSRPGVAWSRTCCSGPRTAHAAPESLRPLYDAAQPVKVELAVPKFRVESGASLTEPLGALGVRTAFTDDADFSGMTPAPVRIDRVEHKAVLEVDEQGLEGLRPPRP